MSDDVTLRGDEEAIRAAAVRAKVAESDSSTLSGEQFYRQAPDAMTYVGRELAQKLEVDLRLSELGRSLTFADIVSLCAGQNVNRDRTIYVLREAIERYYAEKYLHYSYNDDLRGAIPGWADEVRRIISRMGIDLERASVLDVGIGNGLEAQELFSKVRRLRGADISREMLKAAKVRLPSLEMLHSPAERLRDDPAAPRSSSVDLYVSLRTYMSSFFDIRAALREANRVLTGGGGIVLSIANGYVDRDMSTGAAKIVRGLQVPGRPEHVSRNAPRLIALFIITTLEDLGFTDVRYNAEDTDIYIWATKRSDHLVDVAPSYQAEH